MVGWHVLLIATLLAGCGGTSSAPDAARPAGLTIGVGGSIGTAGAMVSQPRGPYATPR